MPVFVLGFALIELQWCVEEWKWMSVLVLDDEYEKYLISNGHVFASYQPIFSRNLELVQKEGTEVARTPKLMQAEQDQDQDQIVQKIIIFEEIGRNIVLLLKCILCSCIFLWIAVMWVLCKNA